VTAHVLLRRARHPVASARRLVRRLVERPGLPVGRTADTRRLLRTVLTGRDRALVVGPVGPVRQAIPWAALDVAGTDPHDREVTVVSSAVEEGSLPRRWDCVIVTDPSPPPGRLRAAAGAGRPGGMLVLVRFPSDPPVDVAGTRVERTVRRRSVELVVARVAS
jgi:hypothetical protein